MKKMKYILNGFLALAMILLFAQCSNNQSTPSQTATPTAVGGSTNIFWNDLNELMIQKEENIRTTLNEKAKELDREMREFQRKLENNGFATRERAEQENLRLSQKQRDLQQLQEKLAADLQTENQKNSLQLRDSINSFLKIYNKTKGYSLIISNTGFDSGNCRRLECTLQPKFSQEIICFYNILEKTAFCNVKQSFFMLHTFTKRAQAKFLLLTDSAKPTRTKHILPAQNIRSPDKGPISFIWGTYVSAIRNEKFPAIIQRLCLPQTMKRNRSFPDLFLISLGPIHDFIHELIGFHASEIPVLTDWILIIFLMALQ